MQQLHAVHVRHLEVGQQHVRTIRLEQRQRTARVRRGHAPVPEPSQDARAVLHHVRLVVDDHYAVARHASTISGTAGNVKMNVVPSPGRDCTSRLPWWSRTMPYEMDRPRPVPSDLVVKKGSKILGSTSGGIPGPVSRTISRAAPGCSGVTSVWTSIRPPRPSASRAFVSRLSSTCWRALPSPHTTGRTGASDRITEMPSLTSCFSI